MVPSLELVRTTDGGEYLLAGLKSEMVGVIETETAASLLQLLRSQTLQRCLGRDGHEYGQLHGAMWKSQDRSSGPGRLVDTTPY